MKVKYIIIGHSHLFVAWGPWGALTPCQPSCGGSGFNERLRSCSTGNNQDCSADGSRFWEVKQCNTVPCPPGKLSVNGYTFRGTSLSPVNMASTLKAKNLLLKEQILSF